jgi:cob(I)alamin adenosyltransferase
MLIEPFDLKVGFRELLFFKQLKAKMDQFQMDFFAIGQHMNSDHQDPSDSEDSEVDHIEDEIRKKVKE